KSIAFSIGSAKAAPRGVAMKAASGTSGGEETPEIVGSLCCTGVGTWCLLVPLPNPTSLLAENFQLGNCNPYVSYCIFVNNIQ
uniref:Uncharacterized protein n=1 Tax=Aegilops tauschii subsp. strangulata TaxID=200361 RepID=A0A453DP73_AEGTS